MEWLPVPPSYYALVSHAASAPNLCFWFSIASETKNCIRKSIWVIILAVCAQFGARVGALDYSLYSLDSQFMLDTPCAGNGELPCSESLLLVREMSDSSSSPPPPTSDGDRLLK